MENHFENKTEKRINNDSFDKFEIPEDLPNNIRKSAYILFGTIVLGIINTIILNNVNKGVLFSTPKMIAVSVLIYGIMFYHFYMILTGKNWARILFVVLFIIFTIVTLPDNINYLKNYSIIGLISFIQIGLQFCALILLFTKEPKNWYMKQKEV